MYMVDGVEQTSLNPIYIYIFSCMIFALHNISPIDEYGEFS